MYHKIILCFLVPLIVSCGKSNEKKDLCELVYADKKEFALNDNVYYFSKSICSFVDEVDGKEYFSIENTAKGQCEILFYDMESSGLFKRIPLAKTGPNAIPRVYGHYPKNLNTIYVTSIGKNTLYLINDKGEVIRKYDYSETDSGEPLSLYNFYSYSYNSVTLRDSLFYIPQDMYKSEMDGNDWAATPLCAVMDTLNNQIKHLPLTYPVLFKKKTPVMSQINVGYSCEFGGEYFVYAFYKSDSLIVTSDHKSMKKYKAKSRYIDKVECLPNPGNDILSVVKATAQQAVYSHFIYDKYRDVYYRFVFFPCNLSIKDDPMIVDDIRQEFSVIILSKDFEVIGETRFPKDTYLPKMVFVGKDGLYISENNPKNPDFDENKLVFSNFVLKYNK